MPIYEYQCLECGHELEALRKISDPPLEDCPECGQPSLKKKVSAASFRLKGGGWYETDFKKESDRKRNLAGDGADAGGKAGSGDGDGKADGKKKDAATGKSDSGTKKSSDSGSSGGSSGAASGSTNKAA